MSQSFLNRFDSVGCRTGCEQRYNFNNINSNSRMPLTTPSTSFTQHQNLQSYQQCLSSCNGPSYKGGGPSSSSDSGSSGSAYVDEKMRNVRWN